MTLAGNCTYLPRTIGVEPATSQKRWIDPRAPGWRDAARPLRTIPAHGISGRSHGRSPHLRWHYSISSPTRPSNTTLPMRNPDVVKRLKAEFDRIVKDHPAVVESSRMRSKK